MIDCASNGISFAGSVRHADNAVVGERMDRKLINLCRAHDEICEIAKQVNRMFSIQMLITMAYGFVFITAQFYFMYLGLLNQVRTKE
jgi:hypothetical protein